MTYAYWLIRQLQDYFPLNLRKELSIGALIGTDSNAKSADYAWRTWLLCAMNIRELARWRLFNKLFIRVVITPEQIILWNDRIHTARAKHAKCF